LWNKFLRLTKKTYQCKDRKNTLSIKEAYKAMPCKRKGDDSKKNCEIIEFGFNIDLQLFIYPTHTNYDSSATIAKAAA
jgi:hypothetical protein